MRDNLLKKWAPMLLGATLGWVMMAMTTAWQPRQRSQNRNQPDQEPQAQGDPTEPDGAVAEPGEAAAGPEGAVAEPGKAAAEPEGAVAEPGEAAAEPDGPAAEPGGAVAEPGGAAVEPDGPAAEPAIEAPKGGQRSVWDEEAPNPAALADLGQPQQATPDAPPQCLDPGGWLQAAAATNPGKVRSGNEDRFLLETWGEDSQAVVAAVFDGMGGHGGGDLAAQIARHTMLDDLQGTPPPDGDPARYERLLRALREGDRAIRWRGKRELGRGGMGTTAVVAMLTPDGGLHMYCGDSRLYHYRDGQALYHTKDHTIVQILLDYGKIKPEEVATHSMRSQLTTCLGGGGDVGHAVVEPVWGPEDAEQPARLALQPGDLVLLCSDGLCGEVPAADLDRLVADHGQDPQALVEACIQAAMEAGGRYNVTVIALRWKGE